MGRLSFCGYKQQARYLPAILFLDFAAERFLYKLKHLAQILHHILAAIQLLQIALYRVLNTDEDAGQKFFIGHRVTFQ